MLVLEEVPCGLTGLIIRGDTRRGLTGLPQQSIFCKGYCLHDILLGVSVLSRVWLRSDMTGGIFPEGCNLTLCPHRTQHLSGHWLVVSTSAFWFVKNTFR